jgi:hypothetical protein
VADFYADMRAVASELLAPTDEGGLGQGKIELVRSTPGEEPVNPWDPPSEPTITKTTLQGAASGVSKELVGTPVENGGQVVATDLEVIVSVWGGSYAPGDVLKIDDAPVTVLKIENIPAAGTPCAVRFIVR